MRYLLDTHTLIWYLEDRTKLNDSVIEQIGSAQTSTYVSVVSYWEIATKRSLNKLVMTNSLRSMHTFLTQNDVTVLPVLLEHLEFYQTLPFHHRDPFDRMLIAQAAHEGLTLVTRDAHFAAYPVKVLW